MTGQGHDRIPAQWLERAASALLGCAIGFATFRLAPLPITSAFAAAVFAGLGMVAATLTILNMIASPHAVRFFPRRATGASALPAGDLFLRLQDVLAEASAAERSGGELLLDDPLKLPADSRVVQLFENTSVPTAGELQARIVRHLEREGAPRTDDSGELFDALASLKRSLG